MKSTKQLALDYFAGELAGIKNDIKSGKADAMQPLGDYIDAFEALPGDRVAKLQDFVSLFSTLCDILDYKIQAFKAMVFEIGKDKLARFFQDPRGLDAVMSLVQWHDAIELTTMSQPFLAEVIEGLGRERKAMPSCEVTDDASTVQATFTLPGDERNFFDEKATIVTCLQEFPRLSGGSSTTLRDVLDHLEDVLGIDRMRAFVHILHLIQDGDLVLQQGADGGDAREAGEEPRLRLWRDGP
ncbi:MAG: hypothetical protein GYA24_18565 [Candidatus Lokiarchaeota archaeon]|nr:hypothetical protein [Candidatus Lokiarchaeota archaeon]